MVGVRRFLIVSSVGLSIHPPKESCKSGFPPARTESSLRVSGRAELAEEVSPKPPLRWSMQMSEPAIPLPSYVWDEDIDKDFLIFGNMFKT